MGIFDFLSKKQEKEIKKQLIYKILVVDDDLDLIEMLKLATYPEDVKIIFATSAIEAINELKFNKIDGVMADINMPGQDKLNEKLNEVCGDIPVYRMTGASENYMKVNMMLKKPFSVNKFLSKIDEIKGISRVIKKVA